MKMKKAYKFFLLSMKGIKAAKTVHWYRGQLRPLIAFLSTGVKVEQVSLNDLRRWRVALVSRTVRYENHVFRDPQPGGLSVWTIHGHVRACCRFFAWLVREGMLEKSPAERLELPPLPRTTRKGIRDRDRNGILAAVRQKPRDYALLRFVAATGCRVAGVVGLHVGDLEIKRGQATVREKGLGGNGKSRQVFFDVATGQALAEWLEVRPDLGSDRVFVGKRGPLTSSGVTQIFKRAAAAAGVKAGWNPHNWRHAFARNFLRNGDDIGVLSQLLGHSGIDVTLRHYGGLDVNDLQAAHQHYSPFGVKLSN